MTGRLDVVDLLSDDEVDPGGIVELEDDDEILDAPGLKNRNGGWSAASTMMRNATLRKGQLTRDQTPSIDMFFPPKSKPKSNPEIEVRESATSSQKDDVYIQLEQLLKDRDFELNRFRQNLDAARVQIDLIDRDRETWDWDMDSVRERCDEIVSEGDPRRLREFIEQIEIHIGRCKKQFVICDELFNDTLDVRKTISALRNAAMRTGGATVGSHPQSKRTLDAIMASISVEDDAIQVLVDVVFDFYAIIHGLLGTLNDLASEADFIGRLREDVDYCVRIFNHHAHHFEIAVISYDEIKDDYEENDEGEENDNLSEDGGADGEDDDMDNFGPEAAASNKISITQYDYMHELEKLLNRLDRDGKGSDSIALQVKLPWHGLFNFETYVRNQDDDEDNRGNEEANAGYKAQDVMQNSEANVPIYHENDILSLLKEFSKLSSSRDGEDESLKRWMFKAGEFIYASRNVRILEHTPEIGDILCYMDRALSAVILLDDRDDSILELAPDGFGDIRNRAYSKSKQKATLNIHMNYLLSCDQFLRSGKSDQNPTCVVDVHAYVAKYVKLVSKDVEANKRSMNPVVQTGHLGSLISEYLTTKSQLDALSLYDPLEPPPQKKEIFLFFLKREFSEENLNRLHALTTTLSDFRYGYIPKVLERQSPKAYFRFDDLVPPDAEDNSGIEIISVPEDIQKFESSAKRWIEDNTTTIHWKLDSICVFGTTLKSMKWTQQAGSVLPRLGMLRTLCYSASTRSHYLEYFKQVQSKGSSIIDKMSLVSYPFNFTSSVDSLISHDKRQNVRRDSNGSDKDSRPVPRGGPADQSGDNGGDGASKRKKATPGNAKAKVKHAEGTEVPPQPPPRTFIPPQPSYSFSTPKPTTFQPQMPMNFIIPPPTGYLPPPPDSRNTTMSPQTAVKTKMKSNT